MCGFTGFIQLRDAPGQNFSLIKSMNERIAHRGPDQDGTVFFSMSTKEVIRANGTFNKFTTSGSGYLGFRRLAIQDLSEKANQPFVSNNNSILVYNGEIYNVSELRNNLKKKGINFKTNSDTEVLINMYDVFGIEETIKKIDGMYSFVIIDLRKQCIYFARDIFGIKPLYLYNNNNFLFFSSEVKSFIPISGFNSSFDRSKIDEFILFRSNLSGSLFKDVREINPNYLEKLTIYKDKNFLKKINVKKSFKWTDKKFNDCYNKFNGSLHENIKKTLISDREVGTQLSGGIDSSLVSLIANRETNMKSFSVVFDDLDISEIKYINEVVSKGNLTNFKFKFDLNYFFLNFDKASYHLDYPIIHPNTLGIYRIADGASKYVPVLLSGEGADETLAGYPRYYLFQSIYKKFFQMKFLFNNKKFMKKKKIHKLSNDDFYMLFLEGEKDLNTIDKIFPDFSFSNAIESRKKIFENITEINQERYLEFDRQVYLPPLLKRQDKMTMAFSIENRVPFLNYDFIKKTRENYPLSCFLKSKLFDVRWKNINFNTKIGLKKISTQELNTKFSYRKKMGFPMPLNKIVNDSRFKERLNDECIDIFIDTIGGSKKKLVENLDKSNSNFLKFSIYALGSFKSTFK
jgi:asparagine synthase (glutamine-hydrolysing)